jgi:deoxyxylulose-5-phosphate synthase
LQDQQVKTEILNLGVPDYFVHQDKPANMLAGCKLDVEGIQSAIESRLSASAITIAKFS